MTLQTGGTCLLLLCYHKRDFSWQDYVRGKKETDYAKNFLLGAGYLRAFLKDQIARFIQV